MSFHRRPMSGIFIVILLICSLTLVSGCSFNENSPVPRVEAPAVMEAGTKVDDCDLSGLEKSAAQKKLQAWSQDKLEQKVKLVYNKDELLINGEDSLSIRDLGLSIDYEQIWNEVSRNQGRSVKAKLIRDEGGGLELQSAFKKLEKTPKDASFKVENDQFMVVPAVAGQVVDYESTVNQLEQASLQTLPEKIDLIFQEVPPQVPTEDLEKISFDTLIADVSTYFDVREENRTSNLTKAAKSLDGILIKPGETISFNDTVGPRTPERGYKDAYIIINDKFVEGTGGGICQVSSTLYKAALLSGLEIVERYPHAVAVAYIPPGQDATVSYPQLDLKVKNPYSHYVYLRFHVEKNALRIRVFAKKLNHTMRLVGEVKDEKAFKVEQHPDYTLSPGTTKVEQKGTKGLTVTTYRIVKDAQGQETEQKITTDVYQPANKIIKFGPKQRPSPDR